MKAVIPAIAMTIVCSQAALAAGHTTTDWNGAYAGLSALSISDDEVLFQSGTEDITLETSGEGIGLFAGYNLQNGQVVYGGEIAFTPLEVSSDEHSLSRRNFFDLKGKVGYAVGDILTYATIGYSTATLKEAPGNVDVTTDGFSYGVGIDYMVSGQFFVGAEYLKRNLETDYTSSGFPDYTGEADNFSIALRVGMTF